MVFIDAIAAVGLYILSIFKTAGLALFVAPFYNFSMLWILIPLWLGWIFAEFFQEKESTSLGNAISNGVIVLWAGVDWLRTTLNFLSTKTIALDPEFFGKIFLALGVLAYGLIIIMNGVKAKPITRYIGRIREVFFVVAMFTPIYYNVMSLTLVHVVATLALLPLFYWLVEWLDRIIPTPKAAKD